MVEVLEGESPLPRKKNKDPQGCSLWSDGLIGLLYLSGTSSALLMEEFFTN